MEREINLEQKKVVLFSHDDLDGKSPKFIAKHTFGSNLVYSRLCGYHNIDQEILSFLESKNSLDYIIYITDIGISSEVANKLQELHEQGQEIHLLDHHVTNEKLNVYEWATVIPERDGKKESGTSLFYEHLVEKGFLEENTFLSTYSNTVRKYDTWEWYPEQDMLAHDLNMLFFLVEEDEMKKLVLEGAAQSEPFTQIPDRFTLLMETEKKRIDRYCRRKLKTIRWKDMFGRKFAILYIDQYHPYVADAVQDKFPETDVICMIDLAFNKVSLRARKDGVTVVDIAQRFGGGGHPQAAGFQLTKKAFSKFVLFDDKPTLLERIKNLFSSAK